MAVKQRLAVKGRRRFLKQVGGSAGGAAAATSAYAARVPDTSRAENALLLREISAEIEGERPAASTATNNDENLYANKIASFSKGLPHSQLGEVELTAYQSVLTALASQKHSDAENILIGNGRKLVNPEGALYPTTWKAATPTPLRPRPHRHLPVRRPPQRWWSFIGRLWPGMFLSRNGAPLVNQSAAAELNGLAAYQGPRDGSGQVSAANIFRGTATGCLVGPYISQYLMQTIYVGSTPREQLYRTGMPGADYLTNYSEWLAVQSGSLPSATEVFDPVFRYVRNGRDLAQFVHYDYLVQAFLQSAIIIANAYPETVLFYNLYQLNHTSPYKTSRIQTPFTTFSAPHVEDWMGRAACLALKATWYNKWAVHRQFAPGGDGGRVYNTMTGAASYPVSYEFIALAGGSGRRPGNRRGSASPGLCRGLSVRSFLSRCACGGCRGLVRSS